MNVLFWNIRRITTPSRETCILDTLAKVKPSIVAFQETKKSDLSNSYLKSISLNRNYSWHHLPAKGSAGGILMGVDADLFDITSWIDKEFSTTCHLKYKVSGFAFRVVAVYGSPYEEGKEEFISELHTVFIDDSTPTIIGGDFNLVRYQFDKSNGRVDPKWCRKFNSWIEIWGLLEIKLASRQFTWGNNQTNLIMSTIDRVFCTTDLESNFPLSL